MQPTDTQAPEAHDEDDTDPREEAMLDAHTAEIERLFGKARAADANIGWGWSDGSICSKVYGPDGPDFLTTTYDEDSFEVFGHEAS